MPVDYTDEELEQFGIVFPGDIFPKVVTTIGEAILAAPAFTEMVNDLAMAELCRSFGTANMQELVVKVTSSQNDVPTVVSTQLEAKLREPAFVKALVAIIAKDPEACKTLHNSLETCRKEEINAAAERRGQNLTQAALKFYNENSDSDSLLEADDVSGIVEEMDAAGVVRGKRFSQFPDVVANWIIAQEVTMISIIEALVKKTTDPTLITGYGRILVLRCVQPTMNAVRAELEKEDDIKSALKAK